jgi:2',3'-cyclic-nucleotide 2'-phosphodiesterase (5'-nucleotidase family)
MSVVSGIGCDIEASIENDIDIFSESFSRAIVEVDPEKEYTVLSNSFITQKGGDGYFWFNKHGTDPQNSYATFYSIMAEEIDEKKELTPPEKDGRITVIH